MKYVVSYEKPNKHFVDIEYIVDNNKADVLDFHLPSWRPGRYELGNFAKNIQKWAAYDGAGHLLKFRKITKDCWQVETKGVSSIHIKYNYYASALNAGACWVDENQLYINPVHCFLYLADRKDEACEVQLSIPATYKVACSLRQENNVGTTGDKNISNSKIILFSEDFDELVDSPFIASDSLKYYSYSAEGVLFHIWFQGECKPDPDKILKDFRIFCTEQIKTMGSFPKEEYHFLFQMMTGKFHHGVEHLASTVIALGPSYNLMKDAMYFEFLGISSHELFHAWNVKKIRPVEMVPYDYSQENYSRLGFVTEGITTYYGDLFLYRCGLFSDYDYLKSLHKNLQKHFDNYGRFNLSVADSSFDTWLDGYTDGIPNRKTSIYTEGSLCALMVDLLIMKETGNKKSLDDVMRLLYNEFGKKGMGYSEKDFKRSVELVAGTSFDDFFLKYYYGTVDFEPLLTEVFQYAGLEMLKNRSRMYFENRFGFKVDYLNNGFAKINTIAPNSIAEMAGLAIGDEIISINNIRLNGNLKEWCKYFAEEPVSFKMISHGETKDAILIPGEERYFRIHYVNKIKDASQSQKKNFEAWTKNKF